MEQQLKARLIGASVLVVIAVMLIPELLSSRKPADAGQGPVATARGTRTYTIDLGGAVAAGARLEPAKPAAARSSLPNAAAMPQASGPGAEPDTASPLPLDAEPLPMAAVAKEGVAAPPATGAAAPAATPKPAESAPEPAARTTPAAATGGEWAVQVGAFGSAAAANKLTGELRRDGFAAFVAPLNRSGKTLHRVRVGPEVDKAGADRLSARLKARGLPATVVAND